MRNIRKVWSALLNQDKDAMSKLDRATVTALELKAPRASTMDADALRTQVLGGEIFNAFSAEQRAGIWEVATN